MVGLTAIVREAWNTAQQTEDRRGKIQALSLTKECYSMKMNLLTNATIVDDAIRFVSDKSKGKLKSSSENINGSGKEESNESDYNEDEEDQIEEKEEKEETGEITTATTNNVFESYFLIFYSI
jgi:hypothetical protein